MDQATQLRELIKSQTPVKRVSQVITVTSGKGGVGKSSVSVNLAIQLSRLGKRVVILDADFGFANVEVMLGIRPQYNLADLMFKGKSLTDIITKGPENIGFISGGSGIQELTNLSDTQVNYLNQKLNELDELADVIIIDTGAGISNSTLEFIVSSNDVLLVVTPEPTSITDAYALLKTISKQEGERKKNTNIKVVANRVQSLDEGKLLFNKLSMVVNKFLDLKLHFLAAIPMDSNVSKAVMQQKPFVVAHPDSNAAKAVKKMAISLCNIPQEESNKSGIAGLFSGIIRKNLLKKKNEANSLY